MDEIVLSEEEADSITKALDRMSAHEAATRGLIAGIDLDKRIAEKLKLPLRPYSTDWGSAIEAAESISGRFGYGFILRVLTYGWRAEFFDGEPLISRGVGHVSGFENWTADDKTGPMAICKTITLLP